MNQFNFYANKPSENYHKVDMGLFASIMLLWGLGIFTLFVCTQNYAMRVFDNASKDDLEYEIRTFLEEHTITELLEVVRYCVSEKEEKLTEDLINALKENTDGTDSD